MNIENLRAFLEVTATGSFQKASVNLHITQSSVSARIKALEERLNRELFTRKRDGVALNNSGKAFYPYAQSVLKTWQQAQQEVALPQGVKAVVSLGIALNYWGKLYSDWLDWMHQQAPNVATHIQSDYSVYLLQELKEGLLDLAIVFDYQQAPGIHCEPLFSEQLLLVSSRPEVATNTLSSGYIYVNWGPQFAQQHHQAYPQVPHHRITLALESQALEQILNKGGSAYIAQSTAQQYIDKKLLHIVEGACQFSLTIHLVVNEAKRNEDAVKKAMHGITASRFIKEQRSNT